MHALIFVCSLVLAPQPNNVVQPLTAAPRIVIPVAGHTEGANGTFFRSEISIVNFRDAAQRVALEWIPQLGGARHDPVFVTINPRSGIFYDDFVRQVLNIQGLGSIIVTGATATSGQDPNALLHVTSRIWTFMPEGDGTTSQSLPSVPYSIINTTSAAIFGLRRSLLYRANVGIVNLDPQRTQTFQIADPSPLLDPPLIYSVTLPPLTMQQITLSDGTSEVPQVIVNNVTQEPSPSTLWLAYGASVDNLTGDSWSQLAVTPP